MYDDPRSLVVNPLWESARLRMFPTRTASSVRKARHVARSASRAAITPEVNEVANNPLSDPRDGLVRRHGLVGSGSVRNRPTTAWFGGLTIGILRRSVGASIDPLDRKKEHEMQRLRRSLEIAGRLATLAAAERAAILVLALIVIWHAQVVATRNHALSAAMTEVANRISGELVVRPGHQLPSVRGVDRSGLFRAVDLNGIHLVVTMNTRCAGIRARSDQWAHLSATAAKRGIALIWISGDGSRQTSEFLDARHFRGDFVADVPHDVYVGLGLAEVPQVLLVSNGIVTATWPEPPDDKALDRLARQMRELSMLV
jgi:hypothetical protein